MKVDEFLKQQESAGVTIRATLEALAERPGKVKVTPYRPGSGCRCADALEINADDIESVEPSSERVWCCGKQLQVVSITIRQATSLPIGDVLARMMRDPSAPRPPPDDPPDQPCYYCNRGYGDCIRAGGSPDDCFRQLRACMTACLG